MARQGRAVLEVSVPGARRRLIRLADRPILLGRSSQCDVIIDESFVSARHAWVEPVGEGYMLRDAGSTNGTWVDAAPVNKPVRLQPGAKVILGQAGNYALRFVVEEAEAPAEGEPPSVQEPPLPRSPSTGSAHGDSHPEETNPFGAESGSIEEELPEKPANSIKRSGKRAARSASPAHRSEGSAVESAPIPAAQEVPSAPEAAAGSATPGGPASGASWSPVSPAGAISGSGLTAAANRDLREVLEASKVLLSTLDLEEVFTRVLDACLRIAHAERGFLFLGEGENLKLRASRDGTGAEVSEQQVEFSRTIAMRVAGSGQAEFLTDLEGNAPQEPSASMVRLRLQTIACVPLKIQQRVIGIVYLDSHRREVLPNSTGREVMEVLAGLAAVAIENARLVEERVQNERWTTIGRMAASIVHDIRSPMAALRGTAELLRGKVPDPAHKEKLTLIIGEVDRLSRLSSEMLDFSSGSQPPRLETTSLDQVVGKFLSGIGSRLESEQINLEQSLEAPEPLDLDVHKIARLLHNVVGNALESMMPGGTLTVETYQRPGGAFLAVTDVGSGMDAETSARIFEPFFSHGKEHGTGLGMAIVRRIAEQHSATISIQSAPGSGTRVQIRFPLPDPSPAAR